MTHEYLGSVTRLYFLTSALCNAFDNELIVDEEEEVVIDSLMYSVVRLRHVICRLPTSRANLRQIRRMMASTFSLFVPKREGKGERERRGWRKFYIEGLNNLQTSANIIFFSMALRAHSGPRPLIQFRNHFSQTVGLLGRVISPSQGLYLITGPTKHRKNAYTKHPCLKWDSNPRSQRPSERRQFMS
jgi:hypothetical protein